MKKTLIVLAFALVGVGLSSTPALAQHHAERCFNHAGQDGQPDTDARVCVMVNSFDPFRELVNARTEYDDLTGTGTFFEIEFDYLRLYWYNGGNPIIMRGTNGGIFDSRFSSSHEGAREDSCLWANSRLIYTQARYRLRWHTATGDPVGSWTVKKSDQVRFDCGPA